MIDINQEALTILSSYAVMFYIWMEAFIKPAMKMSLRYSRTKFVKEPVGDQAKLEQDERYTARLHSSFRVISIVMAILFVWGNDLGVSFFDVFAGGAAYTSPELLAPITTGMFIGLGCRGTHFIVDALESVVRFSLIQLTPDEL
jgi:hypothetical protein